LHKQIGLGFKIRKNAHVDFKISKLIDQSTFDGRYATSY